MNQLMALLFQQDGSQGSSAAAAGMGIGFTIVWLVVVVLMIAAMWKLFEKAGEPGWAAIVPIYNIIVLLKIVGKPAWWIVLLLIPLVNLIVAIIVLIALAKSFGKGAGFAIGLLILPFIFYPMLAWGDAKYLGPQPA
jgi:Family of unknown function (DUF5684)